MSLLLNKKSSKKVVLIWLSIDCFLAGVTSEFLLMFFVSASERYSSTVLNFVLQKAATRVVIFPKQNISKSKIFHVSTWMRALIEQSRLFYSLFSYKANPTHPNCFQPMRFMFISTESKFSPFISTQQCSKYSRTNWTAITDF